MNSIEVEKFPDLVLDGRRLVWDSRQAPDGRAELVFLPSRHANPEITRSLAARVNAEFVSVSAQSSDARVALGGCAARALGFPSKDLVVLAATGTNGKTTNVEIMRRIAVAAGWPTAEIGTLGLIVEFPGDLKPRLHLETGFTTPEAPTLHALFRRLVAAGVKCVVMEASSHAMELGRVAGTDFDGALFTNLTQDHLDFHGDMEHYEAAKTRLFTEYLPAVHGRAKRKAAVLNAGDPAGRRMLAKIPLSVTAEAFERGRTFRVVKGSLAGIELEFSDGLRVESPMVGSYNAENLAGAIALMRVTLQNSGMSPNWSVLLDEALANFCGPLGRMERIASANGRHVFVDYAHTPDALEKALQVLAHAKESERQLFVAFGCGGDRDRTKRPLMGKIAATLADEIYLCSDNPRTEDPLAILNEIARGIVDANGKLPSKVHVVEDRKAAISQAISRMRAGDALLVAGKGHENFQIVGDKKIPFSDAEICRAFLSS